MFSISTLTCSPSVLAELKYLKIFYSETLVKSWCCLRCLRVYSVNGPTLQLLSTLWAKQGLGMQLYFANEGPVPLNRIWNYVVFPVKQGKCFDYENRNLLCWYDCNPAYSFQRVCCEQRRADHKRGISRGLFQREWVTGFTSSCGFLLSACSVHLENEFAGMISRPCWLLEQVSDFRFTKTKCKLGRSIHDCVYYSAFLI